MLFIFSFFSCEHNENLDEEQYLIIIKDQLVCMNMPRPKGSYNYPVLPGMEKWKLFTTTQEMIEACQIPTSILKKQTTQAVFQGIWEYPFFPEITFRHNYYQQDFETVFANTSVYNEFITRENAGQCLYSRILLVNPIYPTSIYSRGLELFMSQSIYLLQLSIEEKKNLIKVSFKNDSLRQVNNMQEKDVMREVTWLLISRTLSSAGYKPFINLVDTNTQLKTFVETSTINVSSNEEYDNFFKIIISNAQTFIN